MRTIHNISSSNKAYSINFTRFIRCCRTPKNQNHQKNNYYSHIIKIKKSHVLIKHNTLQEIVNLNTLEYFLDDKKEIDNWQIEIVKKNDDPYEVDELVLYISLIQGVDKKEFISGLSQEIRSETEVSFNRINFVSAKEIQQRAEVESSVKAKRIVDKRKKI